MLAIGYRLVDDRFLIFGFRSEGVGFIFGNCLTVNLSCWARHQSTDNWSRFTFHASRIHHPMPKHRNNPSHSFIPPSQKQSIIPGLGVDVPELQQARALWQTNRFDDALALFEKAVRRYPQNLVALVDASRALGARFEIAKAEALLDRLTKVGAQNP